MVVTMMASIFAIVIVGFVSRKIGLIDQEFSRKLSQFVIQVTSPAYILSSTMGDILPDRRHIPTLLLVSACTYALLIALAYVLPTLLRVPRNLRGMYSFMLTYSNVGFIGYPIVASVFGNEAVFYACVLNLFNQLTIFVWGIMFVTGDTFRSGFNWKLLVQPAMIGMYLAIVIVATGWHAPGVISKPMSMLGEMTVPASLLVIGSSLAGIPGRKMAGTPHIFIMCLLKLIVLPLALYYLYLVLGVDHLIASINTLIIAMPVASFGTMFCLQFGKDETTMSQGTFWSTLLSVISIPILAWIFCA